MIGLIKSLITAVYRYLMRWRQFDNEKLSLASVESWTGEINR